MYFLLIGLLILIALLVLWIYQFVFLMSLEDSIFPGTRDKILWCAAFIVLPIAAPFAFLLWRKVKLTQGEQ